MVRLLMIAGLALALAACHHDQPAAQPPAPDTTGSAAGSDTGSAAGSAADTTDTKQVCCESFGYGAQMVKCCETYAWTAPDACTTPSGMVGGGKQVVADDKCPAP